jgi:hypothetical protein
MGYKVWVSRLEDCLQKSLRDLPFTVTYFQIKLCLSVCGKALRGRGGLEALAERAASLVVGERNNSGRNGTSRSRILLTVVIIIPIML